MSYKVDNTVTVA